MHSFDKFDFTTRLRLFGSARAFFKDMINEFQIQRGNGNSRMIFEKAYFENVHLPSSNNERIIACKEIVLF